MWLGVCFWILDWLWEFIDRVFEKILSLIVFFSFSSVAVNLFIGLLNGCGMMTLIFMWFVPWTHQVKIISTFNTHNSIFFPVFDGNSFYEWSFVVWHLAHRIYEFIFLHSFFKCYLQLRYFSYYRLNANEIKVCLIHGT